MAAAGPDASSSHLLAALRQVETAFDATLGALAAALDTRAQESPGHSQRVAAYTLELASAVGIDDPGVLANLRRGAILHDVGKIMVPESILRKPGPLNADEWRIMRMHPELGYQILQGVAFLREAAEIPLYHHERWDGSGYPRGLQGPQIPLAARLFAIADWLDAITSERSYRPAESFEKAREIIAQAGGRAFDPEIVAAFAAIPVARWEALREEVVRASPVSLGLLHPGRLTPGSGG